jgi:hypothetical protein
MLTSRSDLQSNSWLDEDVGRDLFDLSLSFCMKLLLFLLSLCHGLMMIWVRTLSVKCRACLTCSPSPQECLYLTSFAMVPALSRLVSYGNRHGIHMQCCTVPLTRLTVLRYYRHDFALRVMGLSLFLCTTPPPPLLPKLHGTKNSVYAFLTLTRLSRGYQDCINKHPLFPSLLSWGRL